jgi:hypothetical protein
MDTSPFTIEECLGMSLWVDEEGPNNAELVNMSVFTTCPVKI